MYKKLLLLVAVMMSYNATTLSSQEEAKAPSPFWSETKGCLSAGLKSGAISFIASCMLAKEAPRTKEALMPHVYFAGMAAAAGGAFSILNRLSKYITETYYTNLSLRLVTNNEGSDKCSSMKIPMTNIPVAIPITSIAGVLATAAYYKRYA